MKKILLIILLFYSSIANAQFFEDLVFQLHSSTQTQMNNIINNETGMMLFNTSENEIYVYNGTAWVRIYTDDQIITDFSLNNYILTITLEDGNTATVDLIDVDKQAIDNLQMVGNSLEISLENDGEPNSSVDLSQFLDNTDDQIITNFSFNNSTNILSITLEDANTATVDLSSLDGDDDDDDDNDDDQYVDNLEMVGNSLEISLENDGVPNSSVDLSQFQQSLSISGNDISLSNGGGTITIPSETETNLSQNTTTGVISYVNETNNTQTANVISTDSDNILSVGTDGGTYLDPNGGVHYGPVVYTGFIQITTDGHLDVSGIPFKPSQITFVAIANIEELNIDSDNGTFDNDTGLANSTGTMNGVANNYGGSIVQQMISFGSGARSNQKNISRYASSSKCIGLRFANLNGEDLGKITASLFSFNPDGFTLDVLYVPGTVNTPQISPNDIYLEKLIVLYTAFK